MLLYVEPKSPDVLCGRGRQRFNHPGNKKLHALIAIHLDIYKGLSARSDRGLVIHDVVRKIMEQGGRFLLFDKITARWFDGGMEAARNRVGAAFRDCSKPGKVKHMETFKTFLMELKGKTYSSSFHPPIQQGDLTHSSSSIKNDVSRPVKHEFPLNWSRPHVQAHLKPSQASSNLAIRDMTAPKSFHFEWDVLLEDRFSTTGFDLSNDQDNDAGEDDVSLLNADSVLEALSCEDYDEDNDLYSITLDHSFDCLVDVGDCASIISLEESSPQYHSRLADDHDECYLK